MNSALLKNYKAMAFGGIVTLILAFLLYDGTFFIINPEKFSKPAYIIISILGLLFYWILISFLMSKFPLYKVLGVFGLFMVVVIMESYLGIHENPFVVPMMILFWLGVTYLISPHFFTKYRTIFFLVYGLIIAYYYIFSWINDYSIDSRVYFIKYILIPVPFFTALWAYEQWRWLRTLQADKAKAELTLLKSQVNPHFLFNTLNNLYGLVVEQSEKAPEVVLKLSDMMRHTIYQGKEDVVLLKDEINYLESYIELHKIRYQKEVEITFEHDVPPGVKIAPLLLIILLENAFKHGVEKMVGPAFINMRLHIKGQQLSCSIENNFNASAPKQPKGIGLDNLKKRLAFLYPNQHELIIEEQASIYKVKLNLEIL